MVKSQKFKIERKAHEADRKRLFELLKYPDVMSIEELSRKIWYCTSPDCTIVKSLEYFSPEALQALSDPTITWRYYFDNPDYLCSCDSYFGFHNGDPKKVVYVINRLGFVECKPSDSDSFYAKRLSDKLRIYHIGNHHFKNMVSNLRRRSAAITIRNAVLRWLYDPDKKLHGYRKALSSWNQSIMNEPQQNFV